MRPVMWFLFVASVVSLSCGSATGPSPGSGSNSPQTFTATINNFPWVANGSIKATFTPATTNASAASLNIVAQDSPLVQTLSVTAGPTAPGTPLTTGTYQVGTSATNALFTDVIGTTYQAGLTVGVGSGSVTISSLNTTTKVATGTFNFVLTQTNGVATRVVNNGTFSVNFQ